jgi:hypothetical protein
MKKLNLSLEDLNVESFATEAAPGHPGTVHGHVETYDGGDTCDVGNTCGVENTCMESCTACDTHYCTPDTCALICFVPRNVPRTSWTCYNIATCQSYCPQNP